MSTQPQGKSMRELRAIMERQQERFDYFGELWRALTDEEQDQLTERAKEMVGPQVLAEIDAER